jgi:hypothetical protein
MRVFYGVAHGQRIGEKLELNCETSFACQVKLATSDTNLGNMPVCWGAGWHLE